LAQQMTEIPQQFDFAFRHFCLSDKVYTILDNACNKYHKFVSVKKKSIQRSKYVDKSV
jgi:hypothetical protein